MRYRTMHHRLSIFALVLLATPIVLAGPPKGAFPAVVKEGERTLRFNGAGLCEWGAFNWNLYWGALYLEKKTTSAESAIGSEQAKRVHLYFVRALTRKQMVKAYSASFEINAGKDLPRYQKKVNQLTSMLQAVEKGTSLTFTYIPKTGLRIDQDGKKLGTIEGEAFARMFFTLYFGPKPPDKNLKKGMLGKSGK